MVIRTDSKTKGLRAWILALMLIVTTGCGEPNTQRDDSAVVDRDMSLAQSPPVIEAPSPQGQDANEQTAKHIDPLPLHLEQHAAPVEREGSDEEDEAELPQLPTDVGELNEQTIKLIATVITQVQGGTRLVDGLFQAVVGLSDEKLYAYGKMCFDARLATNEIVKEGPYVERAQKLADPVFKLGEREFQYTISVIDSEAINAFATAGGFIYLNKGLMDALNDEQLLFVIGHEVAHVQLRHTDSLWAYADRIGLLTGDNISSIATVLMSEHIRVGYNEVQELESDEWGFIKTQSMGVSAEDAIQMFTILAESTGQKLEEEDESETVLEELEKQRDHHYRTHPASLERIKQIERLAAEQ